LPPLWGKVNKAQKQDLEEWPGDIWVTHPQQDKVPDLRRNAHYILHPTINYQDANRQENMTYNQEITQMIELVDGLTVVITAFHHSKSEPNWEPVTHL
jgi:hypothetical protein